MNALTRLKKKQNKQFNAKIKYFLQRLEHTQQMCWITIMLEVVFFNFGLVTAGDVFHFAD